MPLLAAKTARTPRHKQEHTHFAGATALLLVEDKSRQWDVSIHSGFKLIWLAHPARLGVLV